MTSEGGFNLGVSQDFSNYFTQFKIEKVNTTANFTLGQNLKQKFDQFGYNIFSDVVYSKFAAKCLLERIPDEEKEVQVPIAVISGVYKHSETLKVAADTSIALA